MSMSDFVLGDRRTQILYGVENALAYGERFMKNTKIKMDITFDHHAPSIVITFPLYYEGYRDILKRAGKIRCITDITKDNVEYCKELLKIVSELRHLDGLKGGIAITESEYMATTILKEEQPLTEVIYSNAKEVVSQNQYVFDTFWNNAIPAKKKIKEIEEGIEIDFVKVIDDPIKSRDLFIKSLKSAKRELLLIIPSNLISVVKKELKLYDMISSISIKKSIQVKLLIYLDIRHAIFDQETEGIMNDYVASNVEIKTLELEDGFESLEGTVITIIDKKISMILDLKNDTDDSFRNSFIFSIHSNNKILVASYVTIFESVWRYIELLKRIKENEQKFKIKAYTLEKQIKYQTSNFFKVNDSLKELNKTLMIKEKALEKTNRDLIENENRKEEFISMIAHELRTPLVPIKGYAEMLMKPNMLGPLNEKQKKALCSIYRNVKKQESLVDDILDVYKLDLGKFGLVKTHVTLSEIFSNAVNDSMTLVSEKQAAIITKISTKSESIYCDGKRIEQVLLNLIKNSVAFVPENGGRICLMAEDLEKEENNDFSLYILFTVIDNGPGIPKDKIANLFKKFYQIDTQLNKENTAALDWVWLFPEEL